jgi:hypothetical protein
MTDREILQREIASILDHPSVYMGGPSPHHMRTADRIINHLEKRKLVDLSQQQRNGE